MSADDEIMRLRDRQHELANTLAAQQGKLSAHEQVCAERQGSIIKRLGRIEAIFYAGAGLLALSQWDQFKGLLAFVARHQP